MKLHRLNKNKNREIIIVSFFRQSFGLRKDYFVSKQVQFSKSIENLELVYEYCP